MSQLTPWMFLINPFEEVMADYKRTFDAWADGGVRGLVIGHLRFVQEDGTTVPAFGSNPKLYEPFGVDPPEPQPRDLEKEKQLHAMLDDAAGRGWRILFFLSMPGCGQRPIEQDPLGAVGYAAALNDLMAAFPQAHGQIIDGPGENHYELCFHHGGQVFTDVRNTKRRFEHLGMDVDRMQRGMEYLREKFHSLTPSQVRYHAPGGMLAGISLFDMNEEALYWLRMREEASIQHVAAIRKQIDKLDRKIEWGGIPRTATFSPMTGQNYQRMAPYFDYIFCKHYFWHRGFDGLYGTVARWVATLGEWNPSLNEADCFAVVKLLFGLELPEVETLADMERGFADAFFEQVVASETRRALAAMDDEDKLIAWVSTGRTPHAGDPMPAHDLQRMLEGSQQVGLKRFLYHSTMELGAAEGSVIAPGCGRPWKEDPDGYWPAATYKPNASSAGGDWKPLTVR